MQRPRERKPLEKYEIVQDERASIRDMLENYKDTIKASWSRMVLDYAIQRKRFSYQQWLINGRTPKATHLPPQEALLERPFLFHLLYAPISYDDVFIYFFFFFYIPCRTPSLPHPHPPFSPAHSPTLRPIKKCLSKTL